MRLCERSEATTVRCDTPALEDNPDDAPLTIRSVVRNHYADAALRPAFCRPPFPRFSCVRRMSRSRRELDNGGTSAIPRVAIGTSIAGAVSCDTAPFHGKFVTFGECDRADRPVNGTENGYEDKAIQICTQI